MYATSTGGSPIQQYWKCEWDILITAVMAYTIFKLPTVSIRDTNTKGLTRTVLVPAHRSGARSGGVDRNEYWARFVRDYCISVKAIFEYEKLGNGNSRIENVK